MSDAAPPIAVIGAGVVGLATALYLRRSGRDVQVIDPLPPPGGASFGNAGMISPDTSVPIALPGMLRKVPSWLADPLGNSLPQRRHDLAVACHQLTHSGAPPARSRSSLIACCCRTQERIDPRPGGKACAGRSCSEVRL